VPPRPSCWPLVRVDRWSLCAMRWVSCIKSTCAG
jgi:uncharacterized protein (DUF2237 family)